MMHYIKTMGVFFQLRKAENITCNKVTHFSFSIMQGSFFSVYENYKSKIFSTLLCEHLSLVTYHFPLFYKMHVVSAVLYILTTTALKMTSHKYLFILSQW